MQNAANSRARSTLLQNTARAIALGIVVSGPALAQSTGKAKGKEQAKPASPPAASPLAGPRVVEPAKSDPLFTMDFNGQIRRPETTPEEAVITAMNLDDKARAAVKKVFDRRQAILDEFVVKEVDLLTKFGVASGTNDKLDQATLGIEAFRKLAPLREGGSLWEQVMDALPASDAKEFNTRMNAYWDAIVAEGKKLKKGKDAAEMKPGEKIVEKERSRFEIVVEERLKILGQEIKDSFERQQASGEYLIKYFTHDLGLSPNQKARIQEMTLAYINETGMKPTDEQQKQLALRAMSILTEEQRLKVAEKIVGKAK